MEYYGGTLCVSYGELVPDLMTASNLKYYVRKGVVERVRRPSEGNPALYDASTLPLKYKTEVYRSAPDLEQTRAYQPFIDMIEPDVEALRALSDYIKPDGKRLTAEKQIEYANNCAIMNAYTNKQAAMNSMLSRNGKKAKPLQYSFWCDAAANLPLLADKWPNGLPRNPRGLQRKYQKYMREGWRCFVSGKFGNVNRNKIYTDEQVSAMKLILAHFHNFDNEEVAGYYNMEARKYGWREIKGRTVGYWRKKFDLETSLARMGEVNFDNMYAMQHKRRRPSAPWLMWTLDGWVVELAYQDTKSNKKGHNVTTYTNRLYLEVVLDPCCDYPIGYAVGLQENAELVKEALRDAILHGKELTGEMLRANQIQSDHFLIKAMTPLYNVVGERYTPARARNAKAKVIEQYFGRVNKKYGKKWLNWSGYGITTNPMRQPNADAVNKIKKNFPEKDGIVRQIVEMVEWERKEKRNKLMAMYGKLPAERRLPLSKEQYLLNFGARTGLKNAMEGSGLKPTILGVKHTYDCFDIEFRKHAGVKWTVLYDPNDLREVLAVNEDGTLRYMMEEKYVQPMALAERKPGDSEQLARVDDFNKRLKNYANKQLSLAYENVKGLAESDPQLEQFLGRWLITDSNGQHKKRKAQARLGGEFVEAEEVTDIDAPVLPRNAPLSDADDFSIF